MTKVECDLTGCKYNSSCCTSPSDNKKSYCTKEYIQLEMDHDICQLDCSMFEPDVEKDIECRHCQIQKYGGIKLMKALNFDECDFTEFKF